MGKPERDRGEDGGEGVPISKSKEEMEEVSKEPRLESVELDRDLEEGMGDPAGECHPTGECQGDPAPGVDGKEWIVPGVLGTFRGEKRNSSRRLASARLGAGGMPSWFPGVAGPILGALDWLKLSRRSASGELRV
jgi:hypothetical protein